MDPRRFRPRHATVVAYLALFVALGGTSYAAITLSNNSVKSKHIAKGNVKRSDIGKNAVNSARVAAGSLRASDFAAGQLPAGPAGPAGAKGDTGATGGPGISGLEEIQAESANNSTASKTVTANCPAGKKVVGLGGQINGGEVGKQLIRWIAPVTGTPPTAVSVQAEETDGGTTENWKLFAHAMCATVAP